MPRPMPREEPVMRATPFMPAGNTAWPVVGTRKKGLALPRPAAHFPPSQKAHGVLAQLVERRNGIAEVRGSNPLGSTFCAPWRGGKEYLQALAVKKKPRLTLLLLLPFALLVL